ncbi:MAG: leucine-rich repeat domain-containing protein, partial [Ruminococcus sp.]|nr:leucine-rich repeat domain-containing protein [Ruminococcus sp.]
MVKKSISVLLAVVILLSVFTVLPVTMNAATSGDYEYEILDDGTAEITDYIGSGGKVNIPSTIDGHRVTSLGERLFQNDSVSITGISIPNSVTNIGNYTFAFCDSESFTEVTIPNSVKHIGNRSFYKCTYLNSVYISGSVTSIGTNPFVDCANLTSIRIDGSNKVYDSRNNCNAIIETATNTLIGGCNNTVIPNTVKRIAEYAFENSG